MPQDTYPQTEDNSQRNEINNSMEQDSKNKHYNTVAIWSKTPSVLPYYHHWTLVTEGLPP